MSIFDAYMPTSGSKFPLVRVRAVRRNLSNTQPKPTSVSINRRLGVVVMHHAVVGGGNEAATHFDLAEWVKLVRATMTNEELHSLAGVEESVTPPAYRLDGVDPRRDLNDWFCELRETDQPRLQRTAAGLTQAELGELVGVSPHSISAWERGKKTPSTLSLCFRYYQWLNARIQRNGPVELA